MSKESMIRLIDERSGIRKDLTIKEFLEQYPRDMRFGDFLLYATPLPSRQEISAERVEGLCEIFQRYTITKLHLNAQELPGEESSNSSTKYAAASIPFVQKMLQQFQICAKSELRLTGINPVDIDEPLQAVFRAGPFRKLHVSEFDEVDRKAKRVLSRIFSVGPGFECLVIDADGIIPPLAFDAMLIGIASSTTLKRIEITGVVSEQNLASLATLLNDDSSSSFRHSLQIMLPPNCLLLQRMNNYMKRGQMRRLKSLSIGFADAGSCKWRLNTTVTSSLVEMISSPHLLGLELQSCSLTLEGFETLCSALCSSQERFVKEFRLINPSTFCMKQVDTLLSMLRNNHTLTSLSLRKCNFGLYGVCLMEALEAKHNLLWINVNECSGILSAHKLRWFQARNRLGSLAAEAPALILHALDKIKDSGVSRTLRLSAIFQAVQTMAAILDKGTKGRVSDFSTAAQVSKPNI